MTAVIKKKEKMKSLLANDTDTQTDSINICTDISPFLLSWFLISTSSLSTEICKNILTLLVVLYLWGTSSTKMSALAPNLKLHHHVWQCKKHNWLQASPNFSQKYLNLFGYLNQFGGKTELECTWKFDNSIWTPSQLAE